jgi:predicted SprT family Zn-dependent metalloprotease
MTTVSAARAQARRLMDENGLYNWRLVFDNHRTSAGRCDYDVRTISLSRPVLEVNPLEEVIDTILHEIAHALVGADAGHGRIWRKQFLALGGSGRVTQDPRTVTIPPGKYIATCSTCGTVHQRYRKTPGMAERTLFCRFCSTPNDYVTGRLIWVARTS